MSDYNIELNVSCNKILVYINKCISKNDVD